MRVREHGDWCHFSLLGFERLIRRVEKAPAKVDTAPRRMERAIIMGVRDNSTFMVGAIGRHEFPMVTLSILMGGHARVGFEDNVYLTKGILAKSNSELVEKIVRISKELGREIATPNEARKILGL